MVDGAMSAEPAKQPIAPTGDSKQTWPQGFLRTVESFRDFEMTPEFWGEEDTNSGLFIRCAAPANPGSLGSCYEINISDPHATTPTGGIVGVHSPLHQATANQPTHAKDRIGPGPWYNVNLQLIANNLAELHARTGDAALFLDERGQRINGQSGLPARLSTTF